MANFRDCKAYRLLKKPCAICKKTKTVEAFVDRAYSSISVEWLCAKHYKEKKRLLEESKAWLQAGLDLLSYAQAESKRIFEDHK